MNGFVDKIVRFLGSRKFYLFVLGFFVFEALWIVFSAVYPMAFDEEFHFGIIRIYSQQWLPFLAGQPDNASQFGALGTDPSYLYHYLMSFPYRIVSVFSDNLAAQVIVLRLLNVAIMTVGVMLFGKILLRAGASAAFTNTAILLFALVPTVPLLAGQINYDSLILLAFAGTCWLVLDITEDLRARRLNLGTYVLLAALLMLSCLVKYPFLPLAVTAVAYVAFILWRTFRGRELWRAVAKSYRALSRRTALGLLVLFAVSAVLFVQRYGYNLAVYHDPVPDCGAVLSVEDCMEYGPWARNYRYAAAKPTDFRPDPVAFTWQWLQGLHYRLFFMITGPPSHTNYPPAQLPSASAIVIVLFGIMALVFYGRQAFRGRPFLVFALAATLAYALALWALQNYPQYVATGRLVAINGRYFIPLLLPLAVVLGCGLSVALRSRTVKTWTAVGAIVLFLQGGGVFSFILRSDQAWYWPNRAVIAVNTAAQQVLSKVMYIGPKHY